LNQACKLKSGRRIAVSIDYTLLQAALAGYIAQHRQLEEKIAAIRKQLGGRAKADGFRDTVSVPKRRPRLLSAAARKRIAAAQKRRWASYRAQKKG
jgi:hypothetical protein